jgi:hypothetical protein
MNDRPKIKSFFMKKVKIVQAVLLIAVVAMTASCSTSRQYHSREYSGPGSNLSLIIGPSPRLVIMRNPNGMYYYRDPIGHIYWRGYDNRYYLDKRYIGRSYHQHQQYNDWKRYHNNGRRRR